MYSRNRRSRRSISPMILARQRFSFSRSVSPEQDTHYRYHDTSDHSPMSRDHGCMSRDHSSVSRDRSPNRRDYRSTVRNVRNMTPARSPPTRESTSKSRDYSPVSRDRSPILRYGSPMMRERSPYTRDYSPVARRDERRLTRREQDRRMTRCERERPMTRLEKRETREKRRINDRVRDTPEHRRVDYTNGDGRHYRCEDLHTYDNRGYSPLNSEDENVNDPYNFSPFRNDRRGRYENRNTEDDFNEYRRGNNGSNVYTFTRAESVNMPLAPVICKFYNNEGTCNRGSSCKYLHLCKHVITDDCKFGWRCKRSHNILDSQPRSILGKYGLIATDVNKEAIIASVKGALKNEGIRTKLHSDETKPAVYRQLKTKETPSLKETLTLGEPDEEFARSPDVDSSDGNKSDRTDQKRYGFGDDYISLETEPKRKMSRKKKIHKKKRKTNKIKNESKSDTDRHVPNQDSENNADNTNVQISFKFESKLTDRNFRIRQTGDQWKISNSQKEWFELSNEDSAVFSELYRRAFEIREKVLSKE